MTLLSGIFARRADPRETLRPLWLRVVAIAREKRWYAELGVADTVEGRFDLICSVLALVLIRMERDAALAAPAVHLTELFVDDMDAQLREAGVGDLVVGKRVGRLVSALGGRLGAYREALAAADDTMLAAVVARNVSLHDGVAPEGVALALRELHRSLAAKGGEAILAGEI